jgi:glyoxylase-like metal-dependent hydrolase (beta-lactamase superfamily II)
MQPMTEVSVTPLRVGHCLHPQIMSIRDGSWRPAVFPSLAMLIVHPSEGPMLFDTGYDPAFLAATQPLPERFYRWLTPVTLNDAELIAVQLARHGVAPSDVRHLILSHFHADHMAGTHHFQNAAIHCARAGLEAACRGGRFASVRQGVLRALIPDAITVRARFFEDAPRAPLPPALRPFEVGADILGDGSVLAVELPGHCPGHWGLVVSDAALGHHFMVGDAAWSSDAIRRNMPAPAIASGFLGDTRTGRATLAKLHALWTRNPDVRLTPCHCPERAAEATRR